MPVAHKHRGVHWQTVSLLRRLTFLDKQVLILTPDALLISKDQDQTGHIFDEILLRFVAEAESERASERASEIVRAKEREIEREKAMQRACVRERKSESDRESENENELD
jgi:hypothetical protein